MTSPRTYDLSGQERIVRGRMPNLEIVNERFARNLRNGLFQLVRKNAEISTAEVKVHKYNVFLREIAVPTSLNVVSVQPLRGNGLVVCDPSLVFAAVDSLFGGNGKYSTRIEGRDFSPTEQRVIRRLVEVVISSSFEMEIGDMSGSIHICIPYATLEPIRDVLFSTIQIDNVPEDGHWISLMKDQIGEAHVELVVELARARTTVEQLLSLAPGDFIELDLKRGVEAKSAGVPVLACNYGVSNGKYALKVDQLLASSASSWIGEHHA